MHISWGVLCVIMNHSGCGLRQWETTLLCNVVSHWLSPYPEWNLIRNHSVCGHSQWETTLHCNVVSHCLNPYREWNLVIILASKDSFAHHVNIFDGVFLLRFVFSWNQICILLCVQFSIHCMIKYFYIGVFVTCKDAIMNQKWIGINPVLAASAEVLALAL